ncbi:GNAT family N-acetyltransferase [Desmospora profundinema]|uniref:GNAT superfamily N-acetyltransferase n=1 Tax=Desmospora profundinema TaxID=1571184 RepID=A0ABU1INW7_9BACL|nr:GNAT family N-acetyltransferase [Desmospora profundinema]MDR6226098.1 GNAT superfamily N-acetyltransferase [Desmospora profundinema]
MEELTSPEEWRESYPVMRQLRTHLDEEAFLRLVNEMRTDSGYRLFALREEGKVVALAGVVVATNLYNGRHLFVHELVTRSDCRSRGFGERLLSSLHRWGREQGCVRVVLSSGLARLDAHRFYEKKMGYEKVSFVFGRKLDGE